MKIIDIRDVRGRKLAALLARDAYERYLSRDIVAILSDAFRSIASDFADSGLTMRDRARLAAFLQRIDGMLVSTYGQVRRETEAALVDFATVQANAAHAELGALAIDAGIAPGDAAAIVDRLAPVLSSHFVRAVAELPIEGLRLGDWWQAQANGMRLATRRTIQLGLVRGDPLRTVAAALYPPRGSSDPAVFRRARAEAQSIVRTATTAVHAQADLESYASAGADVTGQYELLTARDARVSQICAALDGQVFRYNDPNRKVPPFHINCRTTILPMLNYSALGVAPPAGAGAPLTIQSFSSWLGKQPMSTREDVLGATRAQWFSDGKLSLQQIIDTDTRELTINQLAARLGVDA